jgi:hypothetical protein
MCVMVWSSSAGRKKRLGIMKSAVRFIFGGRCPDGLFVTETVTVTKVSLLYRSPSFVLLASKHHSWSGNRHQKLHRVRTSTRPYHSLVTFSHRGEPNQCEPHKKSGNCLNVVKTACATLLRSGIWDILVSYKRIHALDVPIPILTYQETV